MASSATRPTPERLYRLLADNATDVVTLHDLSGRYLYVSPSIAAFAGYGPEELVGTPCWRMAHPEDVAGVQQTMATALSGEHVVVFEQRIRHKDGHYIWVETTARRVGDEVQCSSRGVTERHEAAAELGRRLAQQSAVARLGEAALQRPELQTLLDEAVRTVAETLDIEIVSIFEHLGEGMVNVRAGIGWNEGFVGSQFEMSSFRDPGERARYAHGPVLIGDLPNDDGYRARPLREHGVVSSANVLIGSADEPIGMLAANSRRRRAFDERDLDFLQAVAHVVAGAIERLRTERRMRHDALHDSLTGLPNRSLLLDRLHQALARATREGTRIALLFVDLDNLKVLNDSLGHGAGDELLRAIGPRLHAQLRSSDTVARFGGDEFAIVCENVADIDQALGIAGRIVGAFEEPFIVDGEARFGSVSVGVVVTEAGIPRGAAELLSDADAAMYRAKERGRGRFEVFDAGLRDRITARLQVEADLRRALEGEGRLWVAYQPYYRLPGRRLAGVEALVRWDHPELGSVSPADFIPVAEESGLVVPLGARVLRAACEQVARWQRDTGNAGLRLTVNVSARQMAAPDFVETVQSALADSGLAPGSLGLEITERLLLEETPGTALTIELLQALGVRLLLDDFGTGYSSLRYLQRYPLDGLKVDRSFVMGLGEDGHGDSAIVEAIVGMARALGMAVIPEGVETEGQLERLCALGCDHAQGFLLSRPLPAADIESLLRSPV